MPDQVGTEYPKWVDGPSGPVIVESADEELTLLGPAEMSKEQVMEQLDQAGISYDKRLGVAKLTELLNAQ